MTPKEANKKMTPKEANKKMTPKKANKKMTPKEANKKMTPKEANKKMTPREGNNSPPSEGSGVVSYRLAKRSIMANRNFDCVFLLFKWEKIRLLRF
ncbi:MAG: hypothetical protein LBC74_08225 [Planctomycetaceae bacterium]|jgi:hypothetical protein|nr:hypothetical protein [Planctomycetaceae bacterium]